MQESSKRDLQRRGRTNVSEAPEMDRNRGSAPEMDKPSKAEGDVEGEDEEEPQETTVNPHIGGQGMGQGRGMNPGEIRTPGDGEQNDQKGGDRSGRAAHSGATGERGTSGGRNKPEPKDQDEKGMGHPRNG
jgi:hypothetical protein